MAQRRQFPPWIKRRLWFTGEVRETLAAIDDLELNTVCQSASCPNIGECWSKKHATFMLMGGVCTRNCAYCDVPHGEVGVLDAEEPGRIAEACVRMELKHVVLTSVNRDDLPDGGADHFVRTMNAIRERMPETTIEVLVPDFCGNAVAIQHVVSGVPDVFNHNIETVPRLYGDMRPDGAYEWALHTLKTARAAAPEMYTKSGIMVGLGETADEVEQAMTDLRSVDTDILTIGQYLRPSKQHAEVVEFIPPAQFKVYRQAALDRGFRHVAAGPFVRSSYNAAAVLDRVRRANTRQAATPANPETQSWAV